MPFQEEVLDILKLKLLPELQEMKDWRTQMGAELKVINGRLDRMDERFEQMDKRFEQVDKRFEQVDRKLEELHADLREVRSLMFVGKAREVGYQVREK